APGHRPRCAGSSPRTAARCARRGARRWAASPPRRDRATATRADGAPSPPSRTDRRRRRPPPRGAFAAIAPPTPRARAARRRGGRARRAGSWAAFERDVMRRQLARAEPDVLGLVVPVDVQIEARAAADDLGVEAFARR